MISPVGVLRGHKAAVTGLSVSSSDDESNGQVLVASGDSLGELCVWDLARRRPVVRRPLCHAKPFLGVHIDKRLQRVWSHGRDKKIRIWDLNRLVDADNSTTPGGLGDQASAAKSAVLELSAESYTFCPFAVSPHDASLMAVPSADPWCIDLVDVRDRLAVRSRQGDDASLPASNAVFGMSEDQKQIGMAMCVNFCGPNLISAGYESGQLLVWDRRKSTGDPLHRLSPFSANCPVTAACFDQTRPGTHSDGSPVWRGLVTSASAGMAAIVVPEQGDPARLVDQNQLQLRTAVGAPPRSPMAEADATVSSAVGANDIALRPSDGRLAAVAGWDGTLSLVDVRRCRVLGHLRYHRGAANRVTFTRDNILLSAGADATIAIWDDFFKK